MKPSYDIRQRVDLALDGDAWGPRRDIRRVGGGHAGLRPGEGVDALGKAARP